jgi:hypothetical protein
MEVAGHMKLQLLCYGEVTPTPCTLARTLVGIQRRSGHGGKDIHIVPTEKRTPEVLPISNYKTQEAII